ncbi:MAG: metallophosphoesterase [Clostridia bacterium]|nr:metallophosphoesterase [Clostridia bacterium]
MNIYAISDLHLSGKADKPMNVFGDNWEGHFEKIKSDWQSKVTDDDVVLVAGDISWGMQLEEGMYDVYALQALKGKKIFIRGNHDYWWNGITKIRDRVPDDTFFFLQNDCVKIDRYIFVGSRGWTCPESNEYSAETDEKIYRREAERFRLAFAQAQKIKQAGDVIIAMIHYPPFTGKKEDTLFSRLFEENGVKHVVFGHIHGAMYYPLESEKNGVKYYLTSCDKLGFRLKKIL